MDNQIDIKDDSNNSVTLSSDDFMSPMTYIKKINKKSPIIQVRSEKKEEEKIYKCCCNSGTVSKNLLKFIVQVIFGLIVMIYCMIQLTKKIDEGDKCFYTGLITFILGIFLPSPSYH